MSMVIRKGTIVRKKHRPSSRGRAPSLGHVRVPGEAVRSPRSPGQHSQTAFSYSAEARTSSVSGGRPSLYDALIQLKVTHFADFHATTFRPSFLHGSLLHEPHLWLDWLSISPALVLRPALESIICLSTHPSCDSLHAREPKKKKGRGRRIRTLAIL
jgi:hypothetical protein